MKVAVISGSRAAVPMGLELAEQRLLRALRTEASDDIEVDIRVVGGRGARAHARRLGARWLPARSRTLPQFALAGTDLVHLLGLDLPPPSRAPFVVMVHDLAPLEYHDEGVLPGWLDDIVDRASLFLTPSWFTATELSKHLAVTPERIRVVGGAPVLEAQRADLLSADELRRLGIEPPYVLRYGGYTTRKNVALLLEAWEQVPTGTLVLAGPAQSARTKILADAPSRDRVVVLDYVPQTVLARLLRTAALLVSTSSYEGFGLPPLEAMAAGTPVVAVSAPFVNEVCGDAALLVGEDVSELADALRRVMSDDDVASRLRNEGIRQALRFSWENVAGKVLIAWQDVSATS